MRELIFSLLYSLSCGLRSRARLHLEIIALRHQLGVLQRKVPTRPRLKVTDRWLWVALSRLWSDWRSSLVIVKPGTVVAWHRKGFRLYWTWKSRHRIGRPKINTEVREIIQKMSRANPLWGAPRIHGELLKLGLDVSQATAAKYMVRSPVRRRSPGGRFSTITFRSWLRWTSSLSQRFGSRFCSCLSFWLMTVVVFFTSTSRLIPRPSGQHSKSWKPSRSRPSQSIFFGIVMPFTDRYSSNKSKPWALRKYSELPDHPGNVPISNESSARCGGTVSTR